jgi:PEP-CTERM motif
MRKFNFVAMLMALVLASPASASENKREANKHKEFSNIFASASKDFAFKFADLSNHKNTISRDLPSPSSFQFKTESEFDWFGQNRHNSHENEHGHRLVDGDDDHEVRWDREHHGGNGHHESHDWDENGGYHGDRGDHEWDDDDDFTQPVPEPETYAMLLAGLFTIGALKRRKAAH